ncbi:MAG TPA: IPT/TIG domain-containing protein [Opitutus sp.]|nr:IPT/TIG domain-containing protein [Opitutus sp.]
MHTNRIFAARKFLAGLGVALALLFFAGCRSIVLTNLTPVSLPENPSQIYTITLRVTPKIQNIPASGVSAHIVVDGHDYPMTRSSISDTLFEFDYQLPPGRDDFAYYFLVQYHIETSNGSEPGETYTEVTHAHIVTRDVLSLLDSRGPVGARIGVVGRGFTPQDKIYLDDNPARTTYESPNALSFYVPALAPGRNYKVMLGGAAGNSPVGTFHIDSSNVTISPESLTLHTGERQQLTFTVPNAAPPGGLLLDVTTDVPESVIMPEVIVPDGQTSVTITVEGGQPGNGSLFLKGYDSGEATIPVSVTK